MRHEMVILDYFFEVDAEENLVFTLFTNKALKFFEKVLAISISK